MKLPKASAPSLAKGAAQKSWTYKNVELPHGTELRANYKGALHSAQIKNGEWTQDGAVRGSPSEAAHAVTSTSVNGWTFWEARLPGESRWRYLKSFR